jgi:hypothetical protein
MYLVLSAFTSSPISLVATTKASVFSFNISGLPPNYIYIYRERERERERLVKHIIDKFGGEREVYILKGVGES